jgi:hypothetical protein
MGEPVAILIEISNSAKKRKNCKVTERNMALN